MKLFRYDDYKEFLKDMVGSNRQRGYLSQLAQAAGCQKSYLSQVLRGNVHFTPEQALGVAVFWRFNELEEDYFLNLVHLGRAGNLRLQQKIKKHLKRIRDDERDLAKRYSTVEVDDTAYQAFYYGSWMPACIHMAVGIPTLKTADAIAKYLNLSIATVQTLLMQLERMGLIKKSGSDWVLGKSSIHLPEKSNLTTINHHNWRLQAVADSQLRSPNSIHYSSVFTLSRKDLEVLHQKMFNLLDDQRKIVTPSKDEVIGCMNCDLFEVGGF